MTNALTFEDTRGIAAKQEPSSPAYILMGRDIMNKYKNEVVKMPVSLFCIFAYYSKDICFDMLLAPFWIKWDGFRIYLKRFKLLFIDSSIVHQTFLSHARAVLSIENTKTTKTRSLSF